MTRVGKYEILDKLGEGSMGVIYRAHDTVLEREVALKTLSTAGINEAELLQRFYREARACARLRHPNIVTVYDFGEEEQVAFIAMELLEGEDLRTVIAERRALTLTQKLTLMAAVCEGLHHAHGKAIIHRDIKPSNIFLGVDGQPRILDFGVARMPSSQLTTSGRVLGTPHYMAPEQLTGKPCDHRSDVFSAAIVTFELIAGTHPFHGSSHGSRMRRIVEGSPESLLAVNPDLPAGLEQTLARALAKKPEERFVTAQAFAEALREQAASAHQVALDPWPATANFEHAVHGTETMMAELLDCLQKFDDAADRGDTPAARAAYDIMCKVGGEDARFSVALEQSAKRLAEIAPAPATAVSPLPGQPVAATPPASDATLLFGAGVAASPEPLAPVLAVTPRAADSAMPAADATLLFDAREAEPVAPVAAAPPVLAATRRNTFAWAALGLCIAVALAAGAVVLLKPTRAEPIPAVAQADVMAGQTALRERAEDTAPEVRRLPRGARLQILRAPRFRDQKWTQVQWVSGQQTTPAVYALTADLGRWTSANSGRAAELRQMFEPGETTAAANPEPTPAPAAAPPAAPAPEARLNADAEVRTATELWRAGEYDKAIWILQRLLKAQPGVPAAVQLLAKVQKAKEVEGR